jgi:D-3-phosphoglycerate dehydrogenase
LVSPATGVNHLDLNYLNSQKISVIKLGDVKNQIQNVFATAELAWGLIIACARRMNLAVGSVKEGDFDRTQFLGRELSGRTLGVVGFGRLGQRVAKYGSVFGMNVAVFETDNAKHALIAPFRKIDSLSELLNISDVVSVHIPFNDENQNCINAAMISEIKRGAIFINTSRGELVDEPALSSSLRSGQLFGVGVDVLSNECGDEFDSTNSPLVSAMRDGFNVIVTPHIGGWAHDAVEMTRTSIVDEFLKRYES